MASQHAGARPPGSPPPLSALRVLATACLLAPVVAIVWVPGYNTRAPEVLGFPFFYWYQLLWVVITAVLMSVAFQALRRDAVARRRGADADGGIGDAPGDPW